MRRFVNGYKRRVLLRFQWAGRQSPMTLVLLAGLLPGGILAVLLALAAAFARDHDAPIWILWNWSIIPFTLLPGTAYFGGLWISKHEVDRRQAFAIFSSLAVLTWVVVALGMPFVQATRVGLRFDAVEASQYLPFGTYYPWNLLEQARYVAENPPEGGYSRGTSVPLSHPPNYTLFGVFGKITTSLVVLLSGMFGWAIERDMHLRPVPDRVARGVVMWLFYAPLSLGPVVYWGERVAATGSASGTWPVFVGVIPAALLLWYWLDRVAKDEVVQAAVRAISEAAVSGRRWGVKALKDVPGLGIRAGERFGFGGELDESVRLSPTSVTPADLLGHLGAFEMLPDLADLLSPFPAPTPGPPVRLVRSRPQSSE